MRWLLVGVICVGIASVAMVMYYQLPTWSGPEGNEPVACTAEAMICPDGTAVGRTGPNCEFAPCPEPEVTGSDLPSDIQAQIDVHSDLIRLESPEPLSDIASPLTITGEARGTWFFEASFPVVLVDWDGKIIAEGHATADGDWMTEEFVPFTATLEFEKPEYSPSGALILQKDNPSGLPENDDALEVPIFFEGVTGGEFYAI